MKRLIENNIIVYYGVLSSVICFLAGAIPTAIIDGTMLLPALYLPGIVFGVCLALGLQRGNQGYRALHLSLILVSTAIYFGYLLFISKDIAFNLALRRVSAGGLSATLLLASVQLIYKI